MLTILRYIMLTATRDFLFLGLLLGLLLATGLSAVLGTTALVEKEAMMLSFASASARLVLMVGLVVFVCFHLRHAFEQKEMDVLISRPLSRPQIMLAYWLGFSAVAFLLVLTAVMLLSFLPLPNPAGFAVWGVSLLLESWLVVALAMFAAFTLQSAVSAVLAAMGFYVLGRMMAFFMLVVKTKLAIGSLWVSQIVKGLLAGISLVMPRLDLFSQSDWLIYGITNSQELMLAGIQALVFIPLLLAASTLDFLRKEF